MGYNDFTVFELFCSIYYFLPSVIWIQKYNLKRHMQLLLGFICLSCRKEIDKYTDSEIDAKRCAFLLKASIRDDSFQFTGYYCIYNFVYYCRFNSAMRLVTLQSTPSSPTFHALPIFKYISNVFKACQNSKVCISNIVPS